MFNYFKKLQLKYKYNKYLKQNNIQDLPEYFWDIETESNRSGVTKKAKSIILDVYNPKREHLLDLVHEYYYIATHDKGRKALTITYYKIKDFLEKGE